MVPLARGNIVRPAFSLVIASDHEFSVPRPRPLSDDQLNKKRAARTSRRARRLPEVLPAKAGSNVNRPATRTEYVAAARSSLKRRIERAVGIQPGDHADVAAVRVMSEPGNIDLPVTLNYDTAG